MLCEVCSRVLNFRTWKSLSGTNEGRKTISHYADRAEIETATVAGCGFCRGILRWVNLYPEASFVKVSAWTDAKSHVDLLDSMSIKPHRADGSPLNVSLSLERLIDNCNLVDQKPRGSRLSVSVETFDLNSTSWDSPREISMMRKWVETCEHEHLECSTPLNTILPNRLVHILNNGQDAKIVDVANRRLRYTALTYSWGGDMSLMLHNRNLKTLRSGFKVTELAATMHDAIVLTWKLGIEYIWIDCLCVLQDNASDWFHETSRMGGIYGGATLTVSPVSAAKASHGFLKARSPAPVIVPDYGCSDGNDQTKERVNFRLQTRGWSSFNSQPSQKRGWCFQERLLSTRTLHFTEEQILFECRHTAEGEDGKKRENVPFEWRRRFFGLHWGSRAGSSGPEMAENLEHRAWFKLIEEYSRTQFTIESDRLPALAALARRFDERYHDHYLAGVWKSHLIPGLLWSIAHDDTPRVTQAEMDSVPEDQRINPQWPNALLNGSDAGSQTIQVVMKRLSRLWHGQHGAAKDSEAKSGERSHSWHRSQWLPGKPPSWSWASTGLPVNWAFFSDAASRDQELRGYGFCKLLARVKLVETHPSSSDPYGAVKGGRLRLRAYYASYNKTMPGDERIRGEPLLNSPKISPARGDQLDIVAQQARSYSAEELSPSCYWDAPNMTLTRYLREHDICEIIGIAIENDQDLASQPLYNSYALIIERVPDAPPDTYRRIGVIRLRASVFAWTQFRDVTII